MATVDTTKHAAGPHKVGNHWQGRCTCGAQGTLARTMAETDTWSRNHLREMEAARTDGRTILSKSDHMIGWTRKVGGKTMVYQLHYPIAGTAAKLHIYAWDHSLKSENKRIR